MTNRTSLIAALALTVLFAMPTASHAGGAHLHKMLEAKHQVIRSVLEAKRACILSLFTHRRAEAAPAKAAPAKAAPAKAAPKKAAAKPLK
jgi:hypothetical protein